MENVIKQGYLKKGASTEGGMFSGIIEKMTPRKWYMLVVRNRVPYLEQYDRDVDVFSSTPSVAYNLSACTSISRTMATTARTFNFVIVCPEELIELIATSREQMVDWCNTLERTLRSLGVFKNEKEEHIYTFCPAVVNLTGRTKNKDEDEEEDKSEEELGAVGGAPALPPHRSRCQVPPIPGDLPRMLSEPAPSRRRLSPPPVPPSHPPPPSKGQGRSSSPFDRLTSSMSSSAPPSPHTSVPLPPTDIPPLPPSRLLPNSSRDATCNPPPLPPGRPMAPASGGKQDRSLPHVPPLPPSGANSRTEPSGNCESDEEDSSDYSSDFVSGAFWEINRKTPIPTARHPTLPPRCGWNLSTSSADRKFADNAPDVTGAEAGSMNTEELDEGYSDLSVVSNLKKSDPGEEMAAKKHQNVNVSKDENTPRDTGSTDGAESNSRLEPTTDSGVETDCAHSHNAVQSSDTLNPETVNNPEDARSTDNFYAPFPGEGSGSAMAVSQHSEDSDKEQSEVEVTVVRIVSSSSGNQKHAPSAVPEPPSEEVEVEEEVSESMYASAADASSLFSTVPPLPPRQDSLSSWKRDSFSEATMSDMTAAASSIMSMSLCETSSTKSSVEKPVPRRRTVHSASTLSRLEWNGNSSESTGNTSGTPPLPPPRRGVQMNRFESVDSCDKPPPLPIRKQSVRSQRPVTAPASSSTELSGDHPSGLSDSDSTLSSLSRQQSFGNSDASVADQHLRQRMRLDRVHSVHSVISLKQSQAEILQQEMELPGVTVTVNARAAQGVAIVDCANAVCIVGWNLKDFPSLHSKFHIGDQLISIGNVKVTSATMAQKMLKHSPVDLVEMLVKRMPHAKVLAIRRVAEGQSIGIKRNGGTAEIQYVDPNGLAAENGLPLHAPAILCCGERSYWVLTEINSRHLNLFFKDNEIEHRLNAVGREITIVVQPSDYIAELKKQLKKMKNYKNYIVQ